MNRLANRFSTGRPATLAMLLLALGVMAAAVPAAAQTPGIIGFHGYLTDLSGNAVEAPEGKNFSVKIYHESEGGDAFWEDSFPARPVVGGVFRILLGSGNNAVPAEHFDGGIKYLGVSVDGGQELAPRLQLVTVPYALRSDTADVALVADSANALGGIAASNYAQKSALTKYDSYEAQISALEAKVELLEAAFANPNCTNECSQVGETGCSEDFGASWVCVKPQGEACLKQESTSCTGQNLCHLGQCTCKPNVATTCQGDNAVNVDSCGQPGALVEACDAGQCSDGRCTGWLREIPISIAGMNDLFVLDGALYAVGNGGVALHYDGMHWRTMATGTSAHLNAIWGYEEGGQHKLYAVGNTGKVLFYDGSAWNTVVTGYYSTLREVFGLSASNVLAVGDGGTILRFNGTSWSAVVWDTEADPWQNTDFHAVWAHSSSQIWVAGASGTVIHNDGTDWSAQETPPGTSTITSLWGISADSVWGAAGNAIVALNSGEWVTAFTAVDDGASFEAIWVELAGNLAFYAASSNGLVYTFDGAQWTKQEIVKTNLGNVHFTGVMGGAGAPSGGVWLIADNGVVTYRDQSGKWTFPSITREVRAFYGVSGQPSNTFALGQDCLSLRYDAGEWLPATVQGGCPGNFNAIWGDGSASTIVAVGDSGMYKVWTGDAWDDGDGPAGTAHNLDVWGLDAANLFVVRSNGTHIYNGVKWQSTGGGGGVAGFGTSMANFWVVSGNNGTVQHFDGSEWTQTTITSASLDDIYGTGGELWAVGTGGTVMQYDGSTWSDRSIDPDILGNETLNAVWAGNLTPIYVAANGGDSYLFNGVTWTRERTTPTSNHRAVYGVDASNVLLGTLYRRQ